MLSSLFLKKEINGVVGENLIWLFVVVRNEACKKLKLEGEKSHQGIERSILRRAFRKFTFLNLVLTSQMFLFSECLCVSSSRIFDHQFDIHWD